MKQKKIIIGNWKMNPATPEEAREIFSKAKRVAKESHSTKVVLCIPAIYTSLFKVHPKDKVSLGLQDIFIQNGGAFTGEISPEMAKYSGIEFVIVGHSERREMGESDELISKKINAVLKEGLTGILCIGEKERDENGEYLEFIKNQLKNSLAKVSKKNLGNLIVAYEPVWAIGKNYRNAMLPKDIHEVSIYIKKTLNDLFGQEYIRKIQIIYGGGVSSFDALDILKDGGVDGLLVGRQSLEPQEFREIIRIANEI